MSTVTIGGDTRSLADADAQWVAQQINGRRKDGQAVCVQVNVQERDAHVPLNTPTCNRGFGGGGRMPNQTEGRIIKAWSDHHLDTPDFSPGDLIAFLRALARLL